MSAITYTLEADFNLDGTYETTLGDDVDQFGGVSLRRGMGADGVYQVSELSVNLDNSDGRFTPENSSGALYGKLRPRVPIRLTAVHNAITYTLWTGYNVSYRPVFGRDLKELRCEVRARDIAGFVADFQPVNVNVGTRLTSAALTAVLDAMNIPAGDRSLDTGAQSLPVHYARNQDAMTAMMDVVRSEMGGHLWVTADGKIRFESRTSRLGVTPLDGTWGDGTDILPEVIEYDLNDEDLVSTIVEQSNNFANGEAATVAYSASRGSHNATADSILLTAGQIKEFDVDFHWPMVSHVTPVATTDYTANDAADGSGTDRTGSLAVTVTLRGAGALIRLVNNHSASIRVTKLQVRGLPQLIVLDRPRFEVIKAIPNVKANTGATIALPFADDSVSAQDYAFQLCRTYRYPYPRVTLDIPWAGVTEATADTVKAAMLDAELGDLILFADETPAFGATMVDDWWYVESISHDIRPASVERSRVTLIPSYLYRNLANITYDLFTRADAAGDLGTSLSGDAWADDSGWDINSNQAKPNSGTESAPNVPLGSANHVVEVSLSGLAA